MPEYTDIVLSETDVVAVAETDDDTSPSSSDEDCVNAVGGSVVADAAAAICAARVYYDMQELIQELIQFL